MSISRRHFRAGLTRKMCYCKDDRAMYEYMSASHFSSQSRTIVLNRTKQGFFGKIFISQKFSHVPQEVGGWRLGNTKSEGTGLIVHAISFQDFQLM